MNAEQQELLSTWQFILKLHPDAVAATVTVLTQEKDGSNRYISNTFPKEEKK
jgi:hypothetical protein